MKAEVWTPFLPTLRQKLIDELFDEVVREVLDGLGTGWAVERDEDDFVDTDWAALVFNHKNWRGHYQVRLESQPRFGLVVLGVWHRKENGIKPNNQIRQELQRFGWGKKSGGPCWDGMSVLPEPFANWTAASGITSVVSQKAELRDLLVEEFLKLCIHFKNPLAKLAKAAASK